jgi:Mg2+ and Co2+ transporter CorA
LNQASIGNIVQPNFLTHLQHNWPLTVIAIGLLLFVPLVLVTGVFPTNQGIVPRSLDPARYWRWVAGFALLLLACWVVLFGSYFASVW